MSNTSNTESSSGASLYVPYSPSNNVTQTPHDQFNSDWNQNAQRSSQLRSLSGGMSSMPSMPLRPSKYLHTQYNTHVMKGGSRTIGIPAPSMDGPFQMPSASHNNAWTTGAPCMGDHCGVPVTPFVADYQRTFGTSNLQPYFALERLGNSPAEMVGGRKKSRKPRKSPKKSPKKSQKKSNKSNKSKKTKKQ